MHTTSALRILVFFALASFLAAGLVRGSAPQEGESNIPPTHTTTKVVVVMVDGLRLQESYAATDFDHPAHPAADHTPRLTSELIPMGTLFTDARTGVFNTITTSCTNTIVTGSWNGGPNRGRGEGSTENDYVDNRTLDRTIFEAARKYLSLPAIKVAYVSDKLNTRLSNHSYHPEGGSGLAPATTYFTTRFNGVEPPGEETYIDPGNNSDLDVFRNTLEMMDGSAPDLLFAGFGNVDIAGHRAVKNGANDFEFYTDAIEVWDDLLANLWAEIQRRPAYQGKTTMIVCSDHGRHDDHDPTSYGSHSGTCDGIRRLMLLVIGPDTPSRTTVDRRVYQSDIAPTVARLLGFPIPEATGQPLYEALSLVPGPDTRRFIRNMRAATTADDTVLAVYRTADSLGRRQLVFQRARPGNDFDAPVVLAESPWDGETFTDFPDVSPDDSGIHVMAWQWTDRNHRYAYWKSTDGGETFSASPTPLAHGKPERSSAGHLALGRPRIFAGPDEDAFVAPVVAYADGGNQSILVRAVAEKFGSHPVKILEDVIPEDRHVGHHRWVNLESAGDGSVLATYAALSIPSDPDTDPYRATWEIFFKDFTATRAEDPPLRLTDNNAVPYVMPDPAIDSLGRMHVVYAGIDGNEFQLFYRRSLDEARNQWSDPVRITDSPAGAWEPSILAIGERVHVVYTDYRSGEGDIYRLVLEDGIVTGAPENISQSPGISRNPKILPGDGSHFHVVWEEGDDPAGETFSLAHVVIVP